MPLSLLLVVLGLRDGLLTAHVLVPSFVLAAIIHTIEVGHSVFKRW